MYTSSAPKIASRCLPSVKNVRTYAKYTCNVAETNTTDPQGDINNPTVTKNGVSFRHSEFHRERCHESGCTKKVCTHLCGTFNDRKAIGNATSSNSESTNLDSTPCKECFFYSDEWKTRVYTKAHNTSKTREFKSSTQKMHNETNFIPTLIKDADDK